MDAKIYSVVDGITTLDFLPAGGSWDDSVAAQFLRSKYADSVEETYCSRMDNEERVIIQEATMRSGTISARYRQEMYANSFLYF